MTNACVMNNISSSTGSILAGCVLTGLVGLTTPNSNVGLYTSYPPSMHQIATTPWVTEEKTSISTVFSGYKTTQSSEEIVLEVLFVQAYEKMLEASQPLDRDIAQLISDNIFDLF